MKLLTQQKKTRYLWISAPNNRQPHNYKVLKKKKRGHLRFSLKVLSKTKPDWKTAMETSDCWEIVIWLARSKIPNAQKRDAVNIVNIIFVCFRGYVFLKGGVTPWVPTWPLCWHPCCVFLKLTFSQKSTERCMLCKLFRFALFRHLALVAQRVDNAYPLDKPLSVS